MSSSSNMVTIVKDTRSTLIFNIIMIIGLFLSYRLIQPCPDCVLNESQHPDCILKPTKCPDCVCKSSDTKCIINEYKCPDCVCKSEPQKICSSSIIKNTNICLKYRSNIVRITPCYSTNSTPAIYDITKTDTITRNNLDDMNISRQPLLVIEIPVNVVFDNSYSAVVFSKYAKQYYFPNIDNSYDYIKTSEPSSYIKDLKKFNTSTCTKTDFCSPHDKFNCLDTAAFIKYSMDHNIINTCIL